MAWSQLGSGGWPGAAFPLGSDICHGWSPRFPCKYPLLSLLDPMGSLKCCSFRVLPCFLQQTLFPGAGCPAGGLGMPAKFLQDTLECASCALSL